jgi:hypothetical protein
MELPNVALSRGISRAIKFDAKIAVFDSAADRSIGQMGRDQI